MSDTDHRDALAGGEDILGSLSDDDVMYDHPVSMTGEPMDPVLFVRWDAIRAAAAPSPEPVGPTCVLCPWSEDIGHGGDSDGGTG